MCEGLDGWLLAGFWLAFAFGRAAKDDPSAPRHEPGVRRLLRGRQFQHVAAAGEGCNHLVDPSAILD
jgi:hypothetical protein